MHWKQLEQQIAGYGTEKFYRSIDSFPLHATHLLHLFALNTFQVLFLEIVRLMHDYQRLVKKDTSCDANDKACTLCLQPHSLSVKTPASGINLGVGVLSETCGQKVTEKRKFSDDEEF